MPKKTTNRTWKITRDVDFFNAETLELPWVVGVKVANIDGAPKIVALRLVPRDGVKNHATAITGEALRTLPLGAIRRMVVELRAGDVEQAFAELLETRPPKGRPRQLTNDVYARVAQLYGNSTKPRDAIAKEFNVSVHQASNYIRGARDRGLLEPARSGRPAEKSHTRKSTQAKIKR